MIKRIGIGRGLEGLRQLCADDDAIERKVDGMCKDKLWEDACSYLEDTLPKDIFEKWIAVIKCRSISANKILLVVENNFQQSWIEEHYLPLIRKALAKGSGVEFQIDLIVDCSLLGEPPVEQAERQPEDSALPEDELKIESTLRVTQGKEKIFRNRTIILKAPIICDGAVILEDCVLTYQPERPTGIILKKNATLTMRNCKVICNLSDEESAKRVNSSGQYLIAVESKAVVSCYETEFLSCIRFLGPGDEAEVVFENCRLVDPINFCELGTRTRFGVLNSAIRFSRTPDIFSESFTSYGFGNIFRMQNCSIEGPQGGMDKENCPVFMIRGGEVTGCKFVGVNNCIDGAKTVAHCEFRQCKHLISYDYGSPEGSAVISDCLFDDCENVISKLPRQSTVEKCRFVRCNDNLINNCGRFDAESATTSHDVTVESCEFFSLTGHDWHFGVSLAFIRGAYGCGSLVKNCVFDRVQLTQGFLIAGRVNNATQQGAVQVENCDFQHWATQNDTGRLIQTHSDICPAESKDSSPVTVESVVITNCRGIDQIKREGCAGESFAMTDAAGMSAMLKLLEKKYRLIEESEPVKPSQPDGATAVC